MLVECMDVLHIYTSHGALLKICTDTVVTGAGTLRLRVMDLISKIKYEKCG